MVGYYSSYLEFLGAVYFSMCLDDILKRKVWSPQDAKKQGRALYGIGLYDDKNFSNAVVEANQAKGIELQAELSKKSIIGLFIISFLLIFCGYESFVEINKKADLFYLQLELAYTMLFFIFTWCGLNKFIFRKWEYAASYITVILVVFFIIHLCGFTYGQTSLEKTIVNNIGLFVCVIMTLPILWQIFITWMYKSVFYGYIKEKIILTKKKYQQIINDIANGNYENVPKEYHEIYMKNSHRTPTTTVQQAMDDSLTEYQGILYNEIRAIGKNVKLSHLFFSWIKYRCISIVKWFVGLFSFKGKLVGPDKLNVVDYRYCAQKYDSLKAKDRTMKMKYFCQQENINFHEFQRYYTAYCQTHRNLS